MTPKTPKELDALAAEVDELVRAQIRRSIDSVRGANEDDANNQLSAVIAGAVTAVARVIWTLKDETEGEADCVALTHEMLIYAFARCKANDLGAVETSGNA